jgi:protein-disulfide isomerase
MRALVYGALVVFVIIACTAKKQDRLLAQAPLAKVGNFAVTEKNLEIEDDRKELAWAQQMKAYRIKLKAINQTIDKHLFKEEAKRRGMTIEELEVELELSTRGKDAAPPERNKQDREASTKYDQLSIKEQELIKDFIRISEGKLAKRNLIRELRKKAKIKINLTKPKFPWQQIPVTNGPSFGPDDAEIVVHEFTDFQCPFCRRSAEAVMWLKTSNRKDVKFYFHDFPLTKIHPTAMGAHIAARCAFKQNKFWVYHDYLFEKQTELFYGLKQPNNQLYLKIADNLGLDTQMFKACLQSPPKEEIEKEIALARSLGLGGTPAFFMNGRPLKSVPGAATLEAVINKLSRRLK